MGGEYDELGNKCVNSSCSVDLYLFNNTYSDVATLATIPSLTGGDLYMFVLFIFDFFIDVVTFLSIQYLTGGDV